MAAEQQAPERVQLQQLPDFINDVVYTAGCRERFVQHPELSKTSREESSPQMAKLSAQVSSQKANIS